MDRGTRIGVCELGLTLACLAGCGLGSSPNTAPDLLRQPTAESGDRAPRGALRNPSTAAARPAIAAPGQPRLELQGLAFVRIPPGEFRMGSADWQRYGVAGRVEQPQHRVRITRGFYLSAHEVTRKAFQRFVDDTGYQTEAERDGDGCNGLDPTNGNVVRRSEFVWRHPGFPQTADHPVVCVSWTDAREFCRWMARQTGYGVRLPTEAEWEYACRAGRDTRFETGDAPHSLRGSANLADVALRRRFVLADWSADWDDGHAFTAPVARFRPNALGLYDMHGNVGEWCADWYDADYYSRSTTDDPRGPDSPTACHVVRGGSWYNSALACRAANRHDGLPTARSQTNGFRIAFNAAAPSD